MTWVAGVTLASVTKAVELRRHTDNDGDASPTTVCAPHSRSAPICTATRVFVSSGMQRATQTSACFLAAPVSVCPAG